MRTFFLVLIVLLFAPLIAAAEGVSFETERGNVYSAGGSLTISENAPNDIVAAGGDLSITGNAGNEVLAAGGSVVLSGKTAGDARAVGGNITLAGTIGGEAVLAGGKIHLLPKAMIASGLIAASGDITVDGTIGGSARLIAGTVTINGTIEKDVDIKAEQVIIGKTAKIGGDLRYESPREARIDQGAVIAGEKIFKKAEFERPRERVMKFLGAWWLAKLIAVMTAAIVIYFLLPERTAEVTALGVNRFGRELLIGFLVFVAIPALVLLLLITVLGSLLGLVTTFLYIAFLLLSSVFGALIFTRFISTSVFKKGEALSWPLILAGVVTYQVIGLIPFLGWLFKFVFFLAALGALSHRLYSIKDNQSLTPGGQT
jgi:cytoskeletal protein CcmA (bactofilin family)